LKIFSCKQLARKTIFISERLVSEIKARIDALEKPFSGSVDETVAELANGKVTD